MITVSTSEARKELKSLLGKVCYGGERAVIENYGKPCAVLVSLDDLKILERVDRMIELREIDEGLADIQSGKTIKLDDFMKTLAKGDDDVRSQAD